MDQHVEGRGFLQNLEMILREQSKKVGISEREKLEELCSREAKTPQAQSWLMNEVTRMEGVVL